MKSIFLPDYSSGLIGVGRALTRVLQRTQVTRARASRQLQILTAGHLC